MKTFRLPLLAAVAMGALAGVLTIGSAGAMPAPCSGRVALWPVTPSV